MNKVFRYLTAYLFLLSTLSFVTPRANAFSAGVFGSLTIGCVAGPQTGIVPPLTADNFSGCTVTVYNRGTSTLAGLYTTSAGTTVQTNPIVLNDQSAGTVTTSGTTVTGTGTSFPTTGAWINQTIFIAGVGYTISAVGSSTSITTVQTLPTLATAQTYFVRPQTTTFFAADGMYDVCVSNASSTPVLQTSCNYGLTVYQGNFQANKAILTSAFTDASATGLQAITGLALTVPSTYVGNLTFHCGLGYSEATQAAGVGFGLAWLTTAPTRLDAVNVTYSSAAGAGIDGPITNLTTTTPTAFGTVTPAAGVVYTAYIDGTVQVAGGGAGTLQIYIQQGTGANVVVIAAGSFCTIF